jgi:predicted metal-dependent hydrolase
MILKIPRLTKGKRSQETKYDYFGNKIDIGDVVLRFFSASPDIGVVASISDKSIEITCERFTKTNKSTYVDTSIPYYERDFKNALKQLAVHNSTKRVWCYSSGSQIKTQNQIVNLTKLNLI